MAIKMDSLARDTRAEREGDWIEVADWPGVAFLVRGIEYQNYKAADHALSARWREKYWNEGNVVPNDVIARDKGKVVADYLLLGWRGFDVEYSPDEARDRLTSEDNREILAAVLLCAAKVGRRKVEFVQDAIKNSDPPSASS